MDFRNWTKDSYKENYEMKVIHSIGTVNIFINSLSMALLFVAFQKKSLSLAAFYTRFKGSTLVLSIPIENLYLNEAEKLQTISTNPSAASLQERQVMQTIYYMFSIFHFIWAYRYQRVLRSQLTYQPISLKRYLEGIYIKYWIYLDCLGNFNYMITMVVRLHVMFLVRRDVVGSWFTLGFDILANCLRNAASLLAGYSVWKRNRKKLNYSFYIRLVSLVIYTWNITISGGELSKALRRSVITRGYIPEVYTKIIYGLVWQPVILAHRIMILVCLREFIEQLQDEEKAGDESLGLNYLETRDFSDGKEWKARIKTLEKEEQAVIRSYEINPRFLKIDPSNCLGSGEFGLVYRGHMGLFKKQDVAIKVAQVCLDEEYLSCLLFELQKLSLIGNHENIVKFYGIFRVSTSYFGNLGVVLEYCSIGSCLSYLKQMRYQSYPKITICEELNQFAYEAAKGLEYLSEKQLIHGDVACRNLLLSGNKTVKITDFEMSLKLCNYQQYAKSNRQIFPWKWMAPEALIDLKFSIKSDIWSYGVLLWEIFTLGRTPYPGCCWTSDFVDSLIQGERLLQPELACDEIFEIMKSCWEYEPNRRTTFTDIIESFEQLNLVRIDK